MDISIEHTIRTLQDLQVKWYMSAGAVIGGGHNLLDTHGADIALTMLYGFVGALGAGLFKLLVVLVSRLLKKKKDDVPSE